MLPGFRFLFAAIVLSISVLMFGIGAAALLRASHREFASNPVRRAAPEPVFAQQNEPPTLALLRVEPPPAEPIPAEPTPAEALPPPVLSDPAAAPEQLAAFRPEDFAPAHVNEPDPQVSEPPVTELAPAPQLEPVPEETPAALDETKATAIVETPSIGNTRPAPEPATAAPRISTAAVWIAALASPEVAIENTAPPTKMDPKPDGDAIKKRVKVQRSKDRRRTVQQRPPPTPPQFTPFGPPLAQTTQ